MQVQRRQLVAREAAKGNAQDERGSAGVGSGLGAAARSGLVGESQGRRRCVPVAGGVSLCPACGPWLVRRVSVGLRLADGFECGAEGLGLISGDGWQ